MLRSCRMPNAPQVDWSAGIGLALFHLALTSSAKSLQGLYWSSRSNAIGCAGMIATVEPGAGGDAACAGAGAVFAAAGAEVFWFRPLLLQPETASAAPTASAIGVDKYLCMEASFGVAKQGVPRAERARKGSRLCQQPASVERTPAGSHGAMPAACARRACLHTAATFVLRGRAWTSCFRVRRAR